MCVAHMTNGARLRAIGLLGLTAAIIQSAGYPDVAGYFLVCLNLVALSANPKEGK